MQPSDGFAHEVLSLIVDAGGSFDVGLSSTVPQLVGGAYTNVTDVPEVPHGSISRAASAWEAPAGRSVIPAADVTLGTASGVCTAVAWVLYEAGTPVWGGRVKDLNIDSGQPVVLSRQVVRLIVPSDAAYGGVATSSNVGSGTGGGTTGGTGGTGGGTTFSGSLLVGARAKTLSGDLSDDFLDAESQLGPLQVTRVFYGALPSSHTRISPDDVLEIISFKDAGNLESFVQSLSHGEMMIFYHEPEGPTDWASGSAFVSAWNALYDRSKAAAPDVQFGMIAGGFQYRTSGNGYSGAYLPSRADWYGFDTYRDGTSDTGFGAIVGLPLVSEFQRWYGLVKDRGKPLAVTEYGRGTVGLNELADAASKRIQVLGPDVQWLRDHGFFAFSQWFSDYGPEGKPWVPHDSGFYTAFNALPRAT